MAYHKVSDVPAVSGLGITFSAEGQVSVGAGAGGGTSAPQAPTAGQVNAFMDTIVNASKSQQPEPAVLPSPETMAARTYGSLVKTTRFDVSKGMAKQQQQSKLKEIVDKLAGRKPTVGGGASSSSTEIQAAPAEEPLPWLWIGLGAVVVVGGGYLVLRRK